MLATKVATCCYCGTRAALTLTGTTRHELTCSTCGAPLHEMKLLPKAHGTAHSAPLGAPPSARMVDPGAARKGRKVTDRSKRKKTKRKQKKGFARRFFEDAFDVIEDIFD